MRTIVNLAFAAVAASVVTACVPSAGPSGGTAVAPTATAAPSQVGPALTDLLADTSILGTDVAGNSFCTYYNANGTMTTVVPGQPVRTGTWSVSNGRVCETMGGITGCSRFDFQPPAYQTVTITSLEGSGSFPFSASVASGNNCGAAVQPGLSPDEANGYTVAEVTFTDGAGIRLGTFRNDGAGSWVETNAAGAVTFSFVEVGRDDWSVYLEDRSRNVAIQLDLWTDEVKYTAPGAPQRTIYLISDAR